MLTKFPIHTGRHYLRTAGTFRFDTVLVVGTRGHPLDIFAKVSPHKIYSAAPLVINEDNLSVSSLKVVLTRNANQRARPMGMPRLPVIVETRHS